MAEFFNAALPFVAMGLTIALLAANGRRGRKNYLTEGMCLEMCIRDSLGILQANHYKIEQIQPVDMFPHTQHIECVVKLTHTK